MSARLHVVSGLGPKEPAAFVVETEGLRLLLDCGEGPEPGRLPDFDAIGRIDAVIASHSHKDHIGALRFIDRIGAPAVYATEPVARKLPGSIAARAIPIRGRASVEGIDIETGPNGHALGGVWLRLALGGGLLYMGDHSVESSVYLFATPPSAATVIFDASYGDAEITQDRQRAALADIAAAGPLLLPVPADGRGPEIALFLQEAGFDVAIDEAMRAAAILLTQAARESTKPDSIARLERLVCDAQPLTPDSPAAGVMVAHGGTGDTGVPVALIARWRDAREPRIVFTGHIAAGTTGRKLVDSGRAGFSRWNVHPTMPQNLALLERIGPRRVMPAFGDAKFFPMWRAQLGSCEVMTSATTEL